MTEAIKTGDHVLIQIDSGGFLRYCASLNVIDFPNSITEATKCKINGRNADEGDVIKMRADIDIFMYINDTWNLLTLGDGIDGCGGKRLNIGTDTMTSNSLQRYDDNSDGTNATYNLRFHIGKTTKHKFNWCDAMNGCDDIDGDPTTGVLQRVYIDNSSNASSFMLHKLTEDGDIELPDEPDCAPKCGDPLYIVNSSGAVLAAATACSIQWQSYDGDDDQKWYAVDGIRHLETFKIYYNKKYGTALSKLPALSDGLVLDKLCGNYAGVDNIQWRYEVNPSTGFRVLRLSYATGEEGEFYLASRSGTSAIAADDIDDAEHVTVGPSPIFDNTPECTLNGDLCVNSTECCSQTCGGNGRCLEPGDDEVEFPWWGWMLVAIGALFFIFFIYKAATMVTRMDTSKYFDDIKLKPGTDGESSKKAAVAPVAKTNLGQ